MRGRQSRWVGSGVYDAENRRPFRVARLPVPQFGRRFVPDGDYAKR